MSESDLPPEKGPIVKGDDDVDSEGASATQERRKVTWYRSSFFNAVILGICNFGAPGIWGAMNSLGGGGQQSPGTVNAANSLTFCLMVVTCALSGVFVKYLGIRTTLIIGALGYAPYAAGLYCNNRWQTEWFLLLGAAICGAGAGIFWMAETAIALSYPEPYNKGRFVGLWLTFRTLGQTLGGAINLGLNASRDKVGSVSYTVFQVFIALQAALPLFGLFLTAPEKVERTDGVKVECGIPKEQRIRDELLATAKLFITKNFLLLIPLIAQAVFAEAVFFSFQGLWFTVRARALASFISGIVAMISGNVLGAFLDYSGISKKTRARASFVGILGMQGAWWIWGSILVTEYHKTRPQLDWTDAGFGRGWSWFFFMVMSFQINYMYLYFLIGHLAQNGAENIRYAGLLRGTESAVQAVSYGLSSISIMGEVGCVYLNFGLWAISLYPAWLVIRTFR